MSTSAATSAPQTAAPAAEQPRPPAPPAPPPTRPLGGPSRGEAPRHPSAQARRHGPLIALGALGLSLLVLTPLAMISLRRDAATLGRGPAVTVEIAAQGMRFVPDEIRVPAGASVQVDFVNRDPAAAHDLQTRRQYRDMRVVLWPGERRTSGFIATDKPGRYAYICTIRGHVEAGMVGVIVVE